MPSLRLTLTVLLQRAWASRHSCTWAMLQPAPVAMRKAASSSISRRDLVRRMSHLGMLRALLQHRCLSIRGCTALNQVPILSAPEPSY